MESTCRQGAEDQEEDVLEHDRLLREAKEVIILKIARHLSVLGGLLLDAGPC